VAERKEKPGHRDCEPRMEKRGCVVDASISRVDEKMNGEKRGKGGGGG
jgi:hypothetical protein